MFVKTMIDMEKEKDKHLIVDQETHRKTKTLAAIKGKTVKEVVKELVTEELKK